VTENQLAAVETGLQANKAEQSGDSAGDGKDADDGNETNGGVGTQRRESKSGKQMRCSGA
jgi:hypothetical protein